MNLWYESLESQLRWAHYNELIKIVQPSPADWRAITMVITAAYSGFKPAGTRQNANPTPSMKGKDKP